ncbi:NACHT domain-containing protein [Desulfovibrio inopinatus]|uniref:NACHT domain-containing protein n=1 Tax=Desulfovibrio inopinatus TaxID=102109 RepID=UPI0004187A48|nr:pentapeptide repeat-containing protein [Desulfovibrio inopinatus]
MTKGYDVTAVTIREPKKLVFKKIKIDTFDLFKRLSKVTGSALTNNFGDVVLELIDLPQCLKQIKSPEEEGWLLLFTGFKNAAEKMVDESLEYYRTALPEQAENLEKTFRGVLKSSPFILDSDFLRNPSEHQAIQSAKQEFKRWLIDCGYHDYEANNMANRFPRYVVYALRNALAAQPDAYSALIEKLSTQTAIDTAYQTELQWQRYEESLIHEVHKPLFGETFCLKDIHIDLRAYWQEPIRAKGDDASDLQKDYNKHLVQLDDAIQNWLRVKDKQDCYRVICGDPGSGKSSYAKMLAYQLAKKKQQHVIFIPLHRIDASLNILSEIRRFLSDRDEDDVGIASDKDLVKDNPLIILDGLDELVHKGKSGQELANEFVHATLKECRERNENQCRMQILFTGRDLAIDACKGFKCHEAILHLLPYCLDDEKYRCLINNDNVSKKDQRREWWTAYGNLTGQNFSTFPSVLNRERLQEITAHPLLNYLVALSIKDDIQALEAIENIFDVYTMLMESVYERVWGKPHPTLNNIQELDQFFQFLEEVALIAWQDNDRKTTFKEIRERCPQKILQYIDQNLESIQDSQVAHLLTAFYFHSTEKLKDEERTIEFTHKSFLEYLVARKMERTIENISNKLTEDDDYTEDNVLEEWMNLFGCSALDKFIHQFIEERISKKNEESLKKWNSALCSTFQVFLKKDFPLEKTQKTYKQMERMSRNATINLLAARSTCAMAFDALGNEVSHDQYIEFDPSTPYALLKVVVKITQLHDFFPLKFLNHIHARKQDLLQTQLHFAIFYEADLTEANLNGANLMMANLRRADIGGAKLTQANLVMANLGGAKLGRAKLGRAKLEEAKLMLANLVGTDLREANLEGADLREAILGKIDFSEVNNLTGTQLTSCDRNGTPYPQDMLDFVKSKGAIIVDN